jgi:hypothetical protein
MKMGKNIILCADGTGNRGGETPDTNVYRMYHAVDLHDPTRHREQITYYDNGVGTSTNKYIQGISGGLGFGFGENVRQLYEFLVKNYSDGDIVYLFGFSRGAATVRAFGGMLQNCGLIDRNHEQCKANGEVSDERIKHLVDEAFSHYRIHSGDQFKDKNYVIKEVRIKFMGIWDTVSALGFPYHRTGDSLLEDFLERPLPVWLASVCDKLFNYGSLAHTFYNYTPNKIVDHVYHAIAIDDERKSFLPRVWDETEPGLKGNITQVWFSGMHSDVGGSYNQTGLAYETMVWMMERAEHHGLDFVAGALQHAQNKSNVHGLLHNSRDGLAIYYRYAPRNIMKLCSKNEAGNPRKLIGRPKIHRSVIDRMLRDTDGYAPGLLPTEFDIVNTAISNKNTSKLVDYGIDNASPNDPHVVDEATVISPKNKAECWTTESNAVETSVAHRRRLYRVFADFTFLILITAVWLWVYDSNWGCKIDCTTLVSQYLGESNLWRFSFDTTPINVLGIELNGDILKYLSPKMFEGFIELFWVTYPVVAVLLAFIAFGLWYIKAKLRGITTQRSLRLRKKIMDAML